ncbi:hypothetical protein WJX82_005885 [Trebouxia sp. C0006]
MTSEAYTIPNNPKCVSLSDLLHKVPRLWDFMPRRNVLFGVNQELRRQAQGLTLCIELEDNAIPALMMGNWPQLKDLSIGNGLGNTAFAQLTMKYAAEIAAHHWPSQSKWHVQSYPSASPPTSGALFCGCSLVHRWRGPDTQAYG